MNAGRLRSHRLKDHSEEESAHLRKLIENVNESCATTTHGTQAGRKTSVIAVLAAVVASGLGRAEVREA